MKLELDTLQKKVLLTGSTGFIGRTLLKRLISDRYVVVAPVRRMTSYQSDNVTMPILDDITLFPDDLNWLHECDTVIHLAGKAHAYGVSISDYAKVNTDSTIRLAYLAVKAGVKRFIFLSSINVNGNISNKPFSVYDELNPTGDDSLSKFNTEMGLKKIASETGLEVVIIRSPLVYGPQAPGNFGKLVRLALVNCPLPLGSIHNRRSFIGLGNLVDLLAKCVVHPMASNKTFLVSDGHDISTTELITMLRVAAGNRQPLFPVPVSALKFMASLVGKSKLINSLSNTLQVDISHTMHTLNWSPPITVLDGVTNCVTNVR